MEKLSETYTAHNREYNLVKRTDAKAMYKSSCGIIEVFKIKVLPAGEIYGRIYPERESPPNDNDFGVIAFCYNGKTEESIKNAEIKYNSL